MDVKLKLLLKFLLIKLYSLYRSIQIIFVIFLNLNDIESKLADPLTDIICFHAQQSAEKYMKAYLVWLDIEFQNLILMFHYNYFFESISVNAGNAYSGMFISHPSFL